MSKIKLLLDVVEDMRRLADSIQAIAEAMIHSGTAPSEPSPAEDAATPEKKITLEEVRTVLAEKSHDGLTAERRSAAWASICEIRRDIMIQLHTKPSPT